VNRLAVIVSVVCLLASLTLVGTAWVITRERPAGVTAEAGASGPVRTTGTADVGGPFRLVDQDGRSVDESILMGKWSVVFFGFTYCPDICPTTLQALAATRNQLGEAGRQLQVVFITVDPERDTPDALKAYLDSVGLPGALGLTGTPEQVRAAAKTYRIFYARRDLDGGEYTMDHSTAAYLMGPDGSFSTVLPYALTPDQKASVIRDAMQQGR
jgi:protein SCO1/2